MVFPFTNVILAQARAEPRGFGAHDRIAPGIVIRTSPKDLNSDYRLFQFRIPALQTALNHEPQKPREAVIAGETLAPEYEVQFPTDGLIVPFHRPHHAQVYPLVSSAFNGRTPLSYPAGLAISGALPHGSDMRIAPLLILVGAARAAGPEFGIWKMNPIRSTFAGDTQPRSLTIRIEPHAKGEVLTLDRIEVDGRAISSSSILYLDGRERDFHDGECSGTQLSRRIDSQTIEILRNYGTGARTWFVRRTALKNRLVLEISEQRADGRHFDRRLVFEKQ